MVKLFHEAWRFFATWIVSVIIGKLNLATT